MRIGIVSSTMVGSEKSFYSLALEITGQKIKHVSKPETVFRHGNHMNMYKHKY
jgi:hypothetical protein